MVGITIGVVVAALLGFIVARFALPRASSRTDVGKLSLFTTLIGLFLLGMAAASCRVHRYNDSASSAEPLRSLTEATASDNVLIEGTISQSQPKVLLTDFVAYVRWEASSLRSEVRDVDAFTYERSDLLIDLSDTDTLTIDGLIYEDSNWPLETIDSHQFAHLKQGDTVVAYGELYEVYTFRDGDSVLNWHVASPFVFYGDFETYSAEYVPSLQRVATYAQILQYVSILTAAVIMLTPLPHLREQFRST